jgi:hypothetical protein
LLHIEQSEPWPGPVGIPGREAVFSLEKSITVCKGAGACNRSAKKSF